MTDRTIGILCISVPLMFIVISLFSKDDSFFDLRNVFRNHLLLFWSCKTKYLTFYVYPLILSIGVSKFFIADTGFYDNTNIILSIFISMLLAMQSIIVSRNYSDYDQKRREKIKNVLDETNNAIIFTICICIFMMIMSLVVMAFQSMGTMALLVSAVITYYLFQVILLNILLIIKRLGKFTRIR